MSLYKIIRFQGSLEVGGRRRNGSPPETALVTLGQPVSICHTDLSDCLATPSPSPVLCLGVASVTAPVVTRRLRREKKSADLHIASFFQVPSNKNFTLSSRAPVVVFLFFLDCYAETYLVYSNFLSHSSHLLIFFQKSFNVIFLFLHDITVLPIGCASNSPCKRQPY